MLGAGERLQLLEKTEGQPRGVGKLRGGGGGLQKVQGKPENRETDSRKSQEKQQKRLKGGRAVEKQRKAVESHREKAVGACRAGGEQKITGKAAGETGRWQGQWKSRERQQKVTGKRQ